MFEGFTCSIAKGNIALQLIFSSSGNLSSYIYLLNIIRSPLYCKKTGVIALKLNSSFRKECYTVNNKMICIKVAI